MAAATAVLLFSMSFAAPVIADDEQAGVVELALPRPAGTGEAVRLEIRTGSLARGARILIRAPDGALVGAVAPFGDSRGQGGGTFTVPLPDNIVTHGRVRLRIMVDNPGQPPRAPETGEIEGVGIVLIPSNE